MRATILITDRMTYEVIVFLHIYKPRNRWHHTLNYINNSIILRTIKMFANGPKNTKLPITRKPLLLRIFSLVSYAQPDSMNANESAGEDVPFFSLAVYDHLL